VALSLSLSLSLSQTETRTFFDVIHEIECGSPRAVAVVGGAFVEEHLTKVLRWRLVKERIKSNVDLQEEMFRPGGPIGDFGNKINLAYLMGLISKDAWKELNDIRLIRNRFAHNVENNNWNFDWIISRCNNLVLWEKIKIKVQKSDARNPKRMTLTLGNEIDEGEREFPVLNMIGIEHPLLANERYIASCRFYVAAFSVLIHMEHQGPAPLF